jgi:hydroxyacylglutathione hydrolase
MIIRKITIGNFRTNCYVVGCEITKKGAVIDPGGRVHEIMRIIKELGLTIEYIFNTHSHPDHTGGNRKLKKITNAKLVLHKNETYYLRRLLCVEKIGTFHFSLSPYPDYIIDQETTVKVGNITFQIFNTPGHSPGGICFYAEGKLFTGDTLFVGDSGATCYKGGNRPALGASLRRIMRELPGQTEIFPGHDYGLTPTSTLDWEKRNNINAKEYGYYIIE